MLEGESKTGGSVRPQADRAVEYESTLLRMTLGGASSGAWVWAADSLKVVESARAELDARPKPR